jgi:hypothetical protein
MPRNPTITVDQRSAAPGRDAVGRDKIVNVHASERRTQIEGWLERLAEELRDNTQVRHIVDNLQYYFQPFPYDDVVGLEAKLDHAKRSKQKRAALRKKEAFSKLLAEWQSYPAAQEIIAYFLAKIDAAFEADIVPLLAVAKPEEIDAAIAAKLVDPVLSEMGLPRQCRVKSFKSKYAIHGTKLISVK